MCSLIELSESFDHPPCPAFAVDAYPAVTVDGTYYPMIELAALDLVAELAAALACFVDFSFAHCRAKMSERKCSFAELARANWSVLADVAAGHATVDYSDLVVIAATEFAGERNDPIALRPLRMAAC